MNDGKSTVNKIPDFWQTNTWFRRTIKTVIFPWGIASIIKRCVNYCQQKNIETRKVNQETQQPIEPNQLQQHDEANFTVNRIEEKYQQYSQNPQDPNAKQAMIDIFKYGDQRMVFQFLVKHMPIKENQASFLPQDLSEILYDSNMTYRCTKPLRRTIIT